MPRHARLLRKHGDLGKRLRYYAEEYVVADLDDARELAVADPACGGGRSSSGTAALPSNERFGPEQTNDRRPALMTFAFPETGAAR
jgi:hypothetical protein